MLYDAHAVRENLRNLQGKRVFFKGEKDTLTPSAMDYLRRERIAVLPASQAKPERFALLGGGYADDKPEHMTHLNREVLVAKNHKRIRFRGAMDTLEAQLLLCGGKTGEILALARRIVACDVLGEPVGEITLYGLSQAQQRQRSHFPQEHYGIPHFMPDYADSPFLLQLNRCRCAARAAEIAAVDAFLEETGLTRPDIVQALNRMSSMLYLLMLEEKAHG